MPVRKAITEKEGVYFITFTCTNLLPLFKICHAYDAVYTWFNHLKKEGHFIIGYAIMPSHVHAIIAFSNTGKSINTTVSNGKRFIAYDLVKRLTEQYVHSSAKFYIENEQGIYAVTSYMELRDINLTNSRR